MSLWYNVQFVILSHTFTVGTEYTRYSRLFYSVYPHACPYGTMFNLQLQQINVVKLDDILGAHFCGFRSYEFCQTTEKSGVIYTVGQYPKY